MKYFIEKIAGIDCIFAPMEDSNSITIQIMCKAGSNNESDSQRGIAHVVEHLFFKGGDRYPNQKTVAETLDSIGAEYNAYTSNDIVEYFVKTVPDFVEIAIDVLADMMMNAKFDSKELEIEKGVIIQEMKMYDDDPMSLVSKNRREWYYGDNSFGRSVIGTEDSVLSFTHDDIQNYKDSLYTKDNLVIIVAGNSANNGKIKKLIEKYFSSMKQHKTLQLPIFSDYTPKEKISFIKKGTEQNHLIISAKGFNGNDNRRFAAKVLASILGGNMSSRLFQNIRTKEGLCYYISSYHLSSPECGTFIIKAGMDKDRFDFGLKRIREEIDNYVKNGISQEEFDKAIGFLQGQIQMGIETSDSMAEFLGGQYLLYDEIESLDEILQHYKNLTLNDVNQLLPCLSLDNLYTYYIE